MNSLVLVTENFSEGSRQEFSNAREFEDRVGRNLWTRLRDQIQQVKTVTFGQVIILQQFIPKSWYWIKSEVLSSWAMFVLLVSEQYFNCKMVFMLQNTATTGSPTNPHTKLERGEDSHFSRKLTKTFKQLYISNALGIHLQTHYPFFYFCDWSEFSQKLILYIKFFNIEMSKRGGLSPI